MSANVIPLRADQADNLVLVDADELARLRDMEATLARPMLELIRDIAHARNARAAAERDMAKVAEHERCGYKHIRVGAFAATRAALEEEK